MIFLHHLKTGGTTLRYIMGRQYRPAAIIDATGSWSVRPKPLKRPHELDLQDIRLIFGHIPFDLHETLRRPARYATILRHPIERVASLYHYAPEGPIRDIHARAREHLGSIDDFVQSGVVVDAESKLMLSWAIGRRDAFTANAFMLDVADRLATRVQLTTDGHKPYLEAVERAFGNNIDYAMLVKMYEGDSGKGATAERRYSPATCMGSRQVKITGNPEARHISTSYAERANLTMRMSMRCFTRLANAFSKKLDNHKAAVAFYAMWYNFARIHQTLRVTPAMEAGISDHVWNAEEIAGLAG